MKTKKGNLDSLVIPALLLILVVAIIAGMIITEAGQTAFAGTPTSLNLMNSVHTFFLRIGNISFVMIAIALLLMNLIGAFLMVTWSGFVIVDIILLPISWLISSSMSNAYETGLHTLPVIANFPIMDFFMLHMPIIIIVFDILIAIMAYAMVKQ